MTHRRFDVRTTDLKEAHKTRDHVKIGSYFVFVDDATLLGKRRER